MTPETTPFLPQRQAFAGGTSTPRALLDTCLDKLEAWVEMALAA
jgi:hypothetical protein